MCMGIPVQVVEVGNDGLALGIEASGRAYAAPIQTALLDQLPRVDDWLLVHIDTAIRPLEADEAKQIADALEAVQLAARGGSFEHLLGDLIDREPELPEHLRDPSNNNHSSAPKAVPNQVLGSKNP